MAKNNTELPIVRFSLATGIAWGLLVLVTGFAALIWETTYGSQLDAVEIINFVYPGYAISISGHLLMSLWAFSQGFLVGLLITYFYKFLEKYFD